MDGTRGQPAVTRQVGETAATVIGQQLQQLPPRSARSSRTGGHFPNDDAVIKLLWLAIRDIEDKRARARAKEKGVPRDQRKAAGRLVEGAVTQGWRPALAALLITYPNRLTPHLR